MGLLNFQFVRDDVKAMLPVWERVWDCLLGEQQIKKKKTKYLPMPNPEDTSKSNLYRYDAYIQRAVFYSVTKRTVEGLVGQIFSKNASYDVPKQLERVVEDVNGTGSDINQISKRACKYVISLGRGGLFVDYPSTGPLTIKQKEELNIKSVINFVKPFNIINWRTVTVGSEVVLTLVVFSEEVFIESGDFEIAKKTQYRVLRLNSDGYACDVYKPNESGFDKITFEPKDGRGNRLKRIPFVFLGSEENDSGIDHPPMLDLANLNIAHYRNSADYEESCYIVGQPTPVFSGLTEEWYQNVLKGKVALGSRGGIPLPLNASANLLQANENTMPMEAMTHKEKQMVAIGARLIENRQVQRTATEDNNDRYSENSILASIANNVSKGFEKALGFCALFENAEGDISFKLNTEFDYNGYTPQEAMSKMQEMTFDIISKKDYRDWLRKTGELSSERSDGDIDADIENQGIM